MHLALRNNNQRLLDLFTRHGARLPVKLAEAAVDENCQRNNRLSTFQGESSRRQCEGMMSMCEEEVYGPCLRAAKGWVVKVRE